MSGRSVEVGTIRQHCKTLRMPTVASQCHKLAEQARRDKQSHVRYLDVLLSAEVEEREHRAQKYERKIARFLRERTGLADRLPQGAVFEGTMRCNLHCGFCWVGDLLNFLRLRRPSHRVRQVLPV